ncbi:MAG: DUF6152 family protein [Rhodospirillaceae bacterium]|nr:DUF6152 family protein [Rhodospirillaceae bacterium]
MNSGEPWLRLISWVLVVLCAITAVLPVRAHHSQGMYDISTWTTLEGTIRQVRWSNPHAWVFVDVEDGQGHVQTWALEGARPGSIEASGVRRDHLLPGDRVSARCHRLRDGSAGCVLGFVTPLHGDLARGHGVARAWN